MGLLEQKKQLEKKLLEIDNRLHFYLQDGAAKCVASYFHDDGTFHIYNEKITTKEDCIAICEWYLKTVKEL